MTSDCVLGAGGQTVSHYRILEKIGSGGMGDVYAAEDAKLGRKVALKALPPAMDESPERRKRFEREARALAALNHPNIVTVYSVEQERGARFLTMELVEGRTLREILDASGPLPLKDLLGIAVQAAEGLAEAHAHQLVHRDLKPHNVMVTREGRVKILDFGLAKALAPAPPGDDPAGSEGETLSSISGGHFARRQGGALATPLKSQEPSGQGRVVGTVSYMSPEQLLGRELDTRSDLFSFGTMLYEMAAGRRPFQAATTTSVIAKILEARPEPLAEARPDLPAELERIIRRCLKRDPAERYRDARDLLPALKRLGNGAPSTAGAARGGARLLLVEDEPSLARGLSDTFRDEGYEVRVVERGDEAAPAVRDFRPDLLVLDLRLPGRPGLEVLKELRASGESLPILVLTAKGEVVDRVVGLELGADDYVPKPFAARELLARVAALLRRGGGRPSGPSVCPKGEMSRRRSTALAPLLALLMVAAAAAEQKADLTALMTRGKLDADLGHYQSAIDAFASIAGDRSALPSLRWEALVRLGLARSAAGDARGSAEAFRKVLADYSGDPDAIRFLTYAVAGGVPGKTWPLLKTEFEDLLRTAEIVSVEELGMGLIKPKRVHLKKGEAELKGVWRPFPGERTGSSMDGYPEEVAAYELDKVLALDMVPPTVERSIQNRRGSLQLWVHGCKVFKEVKDEAPETSDWSHQLSRMKLFDNLIGNRERNAPGNILIDPSWQIVLVDHSRSFPNDAQLADLPSRFDRRLVEKLRALDQEGLQLRLRGILGKAHVQGILKRRDALLAHLAKLVGEKGEEEVVF